MTHHARALFATRLYEAALNSPKLLVELAHCARTLAREDRAGQDWSTANGYLGYTSYASLNDLPRRDPVIGDLVKLLDRHVAAFAEECAFELGSARLKLDSLWVNVMQPGAIHTGHIHPHSVVSGTLYVAVPPGAGALKFEDPRLAMMMAAPPRRADAAEELRQFIYVNPQPGTVLLWESWLRHEVMPHCGTGERISISFNYR
ncbi:MAG: TIGR02466 family protein [Sphingomonas sp.]|jgi:uncharacterized protein (TIGR02466 family)